MLRGCGSVVDPMFATLTISLLHFLHQNTCLPYLTLFAKPR
ncbi:hypothetical protein V6Z11_A09G164800 [Gossypium hirsutum]